MATESKQYKKKIKPGAIELDPEEPVIVVHYDTLVIDQTAEDENGEPKVVQRKASQRRIKLRTFKANSTISKFANEIVDKCKYIHSSKVGHVSNLLEQLKQRIIDAEGGEAATPMSQSQPLAKKPGKNLAPVVRGPAKLAATVGGAAADDDSDDDTVVVKDKAAADGAPAAARSRPNSAARTRPNRAPTTPAADEDERKQKEKEAKEKKEQEKKQKEEAEKKAEQKRKEEAEKKKEAEKAKKEHEKQLEAERKLAEVQAAEEKEARMRAEIEEEIKAKYEAETAKKLEEERRKSEEAQKAAAQAMAEAQAQVRQAMEAEKKIAEQDEANNKGKKKKEKQKKKPKLKLKQQKKKTKGEIAKMDKIENYVEKLYEEDIQVKIKGTAMLLQLVQHPQNLEYFIESDRILGALSRVLAEDRKKSTELITNILEIFFCFSSFSQLHPILLHNKIGDTTMKIVDLEIKRYALKGKEKDDPKKMAKYLQKQERLLFVCFYILLNLAEDMSIEIKMIHRSIIQHLVHILARTNPDRKFLDELHLLIVTFLKKLSIFSENKAEMVQSALVDKLLPFMKTDNEDLLEACLRLLYNLSFDQDHRTAMVTQQMVPMCVEFLKYPTCRQVSVQILYNLSTDFRHKEVSDRALTVAVPLVTQLIIQCPNQLVEQELIALAINMSSDPQNIDMMVAGDGLHHMIKRVFQTHDPLLIKLIRNISDYTQYRQYFEGYIHEIAGVTVKTSNHDFLVESLGTLANITTPGVPFHDVIRHHGLIDFLMKHLVPGFAEDDIVLQVVLLLGTMACDPQAAPMLGNPRLAMTLYNIINEKAQDVDIVLQSVFTIFKLLLQPMSREGIIKHDKLAHRLLDLVVDPNEKVRHYCNLALDIIMEHDENWRDRIREKRFEASNQEWLEFMRNGGVPPEQVTQDYDDFRDSHNAHYQEGYDPGGEIYYINDMNEMGGTMDFQQDHYPEGYRPNGNVQIQM